MTRIRLQTWQYATLAENWIFNENVSSTADFLLTAVIGVAASIGIFLLSISWSRDLATLNFRHKAEAQLSVINTDLEDAASVLHTIRAFVDSTRSPVTRDEFSLFAGIMHSRSAGLRDEGWAERVTASERDAFERAMRKSGFPKFEILERDRAGKMVRAGARPEYYPILYVYTGNVHRSVFGYDVASESVRNAAVKHAVVTGQAAATPAINLVTVPRPRGGVMSFVPVYGKAVGKREANAHPKGLLFGAFEITVMIENIISSKRHLTNLDMYIFDSNGAVGDRLIYWRSGSAQPKPPPSGFCRTGKAQSTCSIRNGEFCFYRRPV